MNAGPESPLALPRGPETGLVSTLGAAAWPPVPAVALPLRQAWLVQPERALQPGHAWLAATEHALLLFAELAGSVRTTATADHDRLWERGDVFEIFIQAFGADGYFEFQIAPNGRRLQLHYPRVGAPRHDGIQPYIRRDPLLEFALDICPAPARWRVAVRLPVAGLLPPQSRTQGAEWRLACCRYAYAADGSFCLSSTAPFSRPDFHRSGEWPRVSVPGGFSTVAPASLS